MFHIDSVSPKPKVMFDASAIIESLKEIKLGKSAEIDGFSCRTFCLLSQYCFCTFVTLIYMNVELWACTDRTYDNFDYSILKGQTRPVLL